MKVSDSLYPFAGPLPEDDEQAVRRVLQALLPESKRRKTATTWS